MIEDTPRECVKEAKKLGGEPSQGTAAEQTVFSSGEGIMWETFKGYGKVCFPW